MGVIIRLCAIVMIESPLRPIFHDGRTRVLRRMAWRTYNGRLGWYGRAKVVALYYYNTGYVGHLYFDARDFYNIEVLMHVVATRCLRCIYGGRGSPWKVFG